MIAAIVGGITVQLRRSAAGWLTIVDHNEIRARYARAAADAHVAWQLRVAAFRRSRSGGRAVRARGRRQDRSPLGCDSDSSSSSEVGGRGATPMPPLGLMIGSSTKHLCTWLTPFVATTDVRPATVDGPPDRG
jgi:hypothetical protein